MINKSLRLTAAFLAVVVLFSSTPAEWLAVEDKNEQETLTYMSDDLYYFSAGAVSAMNETIVVDAEEDDDSILADGDTDISDNDAPIVSEPDADDGNTDATTPEQEPEKEPEVVVPVNPYANIAIANKISNYAYIRKEPNSDAEWLGKIYKK